jgi:hypothetical protein
MRRKLVFVLKEGIHETKDHGWRFQSRSRWSKEPKDAEHEYGKLILGSALIIGLIILAIVAMSFAMK